MVKETQARAGTVPTAKPVVTPVVTPTVEPVKETKPEPTVEKTEAQVLGYNLIFSLKVNHGNLSFDSRRVRRLTKAGNKMVVDIPRKWVNITIGSRKFSIPIAVIECKREVRHYMTTTATRFRWDEPPDCTTKRGWLFDSEHPNADAWDGNRSIGNYLEYRRASGENGETIHAVMSNWECTEAGHYHSMYGESQWCTTIDEAKSWIESRYLERSKT